jgi:hypothetical protein
MGFDLEDFVHSERISSELICPICHGVVEKPVQTPSEHLFCEDELLEWMLRSELCPLTHEPLDPSTITKPGRIITNMLAALERYCPNKDLGCSWQGACDRLPSHLTSCEWQNPTLLLKKLTEKDVLITLLQERLTQTQGKITALESLNDELEEENQLLRRKLKVYDAFFDKGTQNVSELDAASQHKESSSNKGQSSDLNKLSRLRQLETMKDSDDQKEKGKKTVKL